MNLTKTDKNVSVPIVLVFAAILAIPFHLKPDNFVVDDGYFYPQIARYIAAGQGSTFNGWMLTNGYHPLWMAVCTLGAFVTGESMPLLQLLTVVQDVLTLCCLYVLLLITQRARKKGALAGCAVLLFMTMVLGIWRLLEANLALSIQLAALLMVEPVLPGFYASLSRWRSLALGITLGLALLARLDLIFFVLCLLAYQLIQKNQLPIVQRITNIAVQSGCVLALVGPYLLWNHRTFGHFLPISGAIKSTFPHPRALSIGTFAIPVLLSIAINESLLFRRTLTPFDRLCLLTAAGAALHIAYTLCFGALMPWYLTTGYLSVALAATWVSDLLLRRLQRPLAVEYAAGAFLFAVLFSLTFLRLFSNFSYSRMSQGRVEFNSYSKEPKWAFARRLAGLYPAGTRAFIFDTPGGVAYYSGLSILPSDGLVTNYKYDSDLAQQGFQKYAAAHEVRLVIMPVVSQGQAYNRLFAQLRRQEHGQCLSVESPLSHVVSSVSLDDRDIQMRLPETNSDLETLFPQIAIWKLPAPGPPC